VLTAVAWQDICTKFHRTNPHCEKECIKSDTYILEHLNEANPAVSYKCPHGLVDNATPIIIDGKHLGNFFTGQFFLEKPDLKFFRNQAKKYGFDEKAYLEAVEKVPVWTKEKLSQYLDFIKGFIEIIAGLGLKNLKDIEIRKTLKESELKYRSLIESSSDAIFCVDEKGQYQFTNQLFASTFNKTPDYFIGKTFWDIYDKEHADMRYEATKRLFRTGESESLEVEVPLPDKTLYFWATTNPVKDETGKVVLNLTHATDITNIRRKPSE
jgi:two-component system cell cycle sensor histidine kinase/response regulator CckA